MTAQPEPHIFEKVLAISNKFRDAGIEHAFGGAIAFGYYGEPRSTIDIDVNVFVPSESGEHVLAAVAELGAVVTDEDVECAKRNDQVRVRWNKTALDLFFSVGELHEECRAHAREVPFAAETITILSAEHLVVFKAIFDRAKDWIDIEQVLLTGAATFKAARVHRWLAIICGTDDSRLARFDEIAARLLGNQTRNRPRPPETPLKPERRPPPGSEAYSEEA